MPFIWCFCPRCKSSLAIPAQAIAFKEFVGQENPSRGDDCSHCFDRDKVLTHHLDVVGRG